MLLKLGGCNMQAEGRQTPITEAEETHSCGGPSTGSLLPCHRWGAQRSWTFVPRRLMERSSLEN